MRGLCDIGRMVVVVIGDVLKVVVLQRHQEVEQSLWLNPEATKDIAILNMGKLQSAPSF